MKIIIPTIDAVQLMKGLESIINGGPNGPYRLDAQTAMRIRMTHKNARKIYLTFEDAKLAYIRQHSDGKDRIDPGEPGYDECNRDVKALMAVENEIEVFRIDPEKLLERNEAFPLALLDQIEPALNPVQLSD